MKLLKGYAGRIASDGTVFHAVIVSGALSYELPQTNAIKKLDVGSYFGSTDESVHTLTSADNDETVLYIRTDGGIKIE